jgi:D-threonine aldolase
MEQGSKWYNIRNADTIDSPALIVYPDRVKGNIHIITKMIDDTSRLRPHVKTHKISEVVLLMLEAGINKFKCATIAEAEMLGMCKAPDVLLAYPVIGPKLHRFLAVMKKYPDTIFSCLIDNILSSQKISQIALLNNSIINVFIDLNIGMNRTGIKPGKEAVQLYEDCSRLPGLNLQGFHAYDGHIFEKDMQRRIEMTNASFAPVQILLSTLQKGGYKKLKMVIGGSPTFPIHARNKEAECSPGTFIFWDKGYQDSLPEQTFLPAALVITRVVSLPDETKLCLDLGYKSIASENELSNRIFFLNGPDLKIISHSEEHMVVYAGEGHLWKVGDLLYGLPIHICPTCALYQSACVVEEENFTDTWEIIAGRKKIFC